MVDIQLMKARFLDTILVSVLLVECAKNLLLDLFSLSQQIFLNQKLRRVLLFSETFRMNEEDNVRHWFDNRQKESLNSEEKIIYELYETYKGNNFIKIARSYPIELQRDFILLNASYPDADIYRNCDTHSKLFKMVAWVASREYDVWIEYGLERHAVRTLIRLSRANNLVALAAVIEFYRITGSSMHGKSLPIDEICNITGLSWTFIFPLIKSGMFTRMFADWDLLNYDEEENAIQKTNKAIHQCSFVLHMEEHPFLRENKRSVYFEETPKPEEVDSELPTSEKKKKKWF
jgi:hypothetical protein